MKNQLVKTFSVVSMSALALAGCSTPSETEAGASVVVSTSVLGQPISEIVECAGGTTEILIPIGASAHEYTASAAQVASMVQADLVVVNGLGLEGGLLDAVENAKTDGAVVLEVAAEIDPLASVEHEDEHAEESEETEHEHGELDPHFWMDMERVAVAMEIVGTKLSEITDNPDFAGCAAGVAAEIRDAEVDVIATLEKIPVENRVLVTDHHAFNYFATAYDFEVVGAIIPSTADLAAPSSAELSALAEVTKSHNVKGIFGGIDANEDLAAAVAEAVGYDIEIATLYTGSLGEAGSGADTYIGMMKVNAEIMLEVLG